MGFLTLQDMMPMTWHTYSDAAKARWLARMPGHGLVTGVVGGAGGHLLGGFDQFDTNTLWNINLNPLRIRKSNINDNGERREWSATIKEVDGGGGARRRAAAALRRVACRARARLLAVASTKSSFFSLSSREKCELHRKSSLEPSLGRSKIRKESA